RRAKSGEAVVDAARRFEARGQRPAGAESRIASEGQRSGGGSVGAERRSEVKGKQTGRRGRVEGAVALTGEHVRGNAGPLDVEAVGRGVVPGTTRVCGLERGRHEGLLGERGQRTTGEPAFSQAVMPPATLNQCSMP